MGELAKLPTTTAEISISNCVSNLGRQSFKLGSRENSFSVR